MKKKLQLTEQAFDQFEDYLRHDEREESTIEAYLRSLTRFAEWADGRAVTKELAMEWKAALAEAGYLPLALMVTVEPVSIRTLYIICKTAKAEIIVLYNFEKMISRSSSLVGIASRTWLSIASNIICSFSFRRL